LAIYALRYPKLLKPSSGKATKKKVPVICKNLLRQNQLIRKIDRNFKALSSVMSKIRGGKSGNFLDLPPITGYADN